MESFGAYLKSLREQSGKTLDQLSHSTKIAVTNLEFLEGDRYDLLPPKVFIKGFIRSYVKELGLDPEEAIKRFDEFIRDGDMPEYLESEASNFMPDSSRSSFIYNPWFTRILTVVGLLSLAVLVLTGVTRIFYSPKSPVENVSSREPASNAQKTVRLEPSQSSTGESQQTRTGKKILEIKASGNAWVRVEPDGGQAEEFMMAPGDIQVFSANKSFRLMTGNAGGIRIRFDGRVLPPLGKNNQTLSLTLP